MMMTQARYLVAVVDCGSFTKAAALLHVSQPALSQRVRQLEEALGTRLVERTNRSVKPTDAGRLYVECMRRAMREVDNGKRSIDDVGELRAGTLRLAFLPLFTTYLIGPAVQTFHRLHPGVTITVDVLAQSLLEAGLESDAFDLGIAYDDVKTDALLIEPLYTQKLCLVVGEGHPAYRRRQLPAAALDGSYLALLGPSFVTRPPVDAYFRRNHVVPRVAIECNSVDALVAIVRGGAIATVLPEDTARLVPGLKAVQLVPTLPTRTVSILRPRGSYVSVAATAFIELMRSWDWKANQPGRGRAAAVGDANAGLPPRRDDAGRPTVVKRSERRS